VFTVFKNELLVANTSFNGYAYLLSRI